MKMPNTKYTGSFIKGGPGENQSYKKYYGSMLKGFKEGGTIRKTTSIFGVRHFHFLDPITFFKTLA